LANKAGATEASTTARILEALATKPGSTAAEIADITKLGRSTISKESMERANPRRPPRRATRRPQTQRRVKPSRIGRLNTAEMSQGPL
jgi:hypothetical protein